jgi:hypothetical protein
VGARRRHIDGTSFADDLPPVREVEQDHAPRFPAL